LLNKVNIGPAVKKSSMNASSIAAVSIAILVALGAFGAYEYSQYSYEEGVASGLSSQVSSLSSASSTLQGQLSQAQANLTSMTNLKNSLQTQLTQANANVTALQGQTVSLQTQLTQADANVTSLTNLKDSLQTQLTQANANVTALQGQLTAINGQIAQLKAQISNDEALLSLTVTNMLVNSQTFNLSPNVSTSSVTFPFVSAATPRSWGDIGVVVTGQGPANPEVSQTGYEDCIFVLTCSVLLNERVTTGDLLLVFVSGYSPNPGWRGQSINDTLGTTFALYNGVNWQAATNTYLDSVYYGTSASTGLDNVTVTYTSLAQHSDPIVMDVTGSGLTIYSGSSAVCTTACTTNLATSPARVNGSFLAAATAYPDLGVSATAGSGWTQVTTGAVLAGATSSFITGEYTTGLPSSSGCTLQSLLPPNYVAKYPGYLSITGTTSSPNAQLVVSYPGTTQTTATYPIGTTVSATIPIIPGNVNVQLEDCGGTPLAATLSVNEVT
jgi:phage shock protein A